MSSQSAPNPFQFVDTRGIGGTSEVRRVHGANGGAHDKICADSGVNQLTQHTDLNGSQTATACKHESRSLSGMGHDRAFLYRRSVGYIESPLWGRPISRSGCDGVFSKDV
jgi:hypothetical protein